MNTTAEPSINIEDNAATETIYIHDMPKRLHYGAVGQGYSTEMSVFPAIVEGQPEQW